VLALTRKKGESIMIGEQAEIVVLSISGEQVRLGVIAPKDVPVHRKEVFEQIRTENKEAQASVKPASLKNYLSAAQKEIKGK
jgi:carbon storage regulator